jgi:hypothetical protein
MFSLECGDLSPLWIFVAPSKAATNRRTPKKWGPIWREWPDLLLYRPPAADAHEIIESSRLSRNSNEPPG